MRRRAWRTKGIVLLVAASASHVLSGEEPATKDDASGRRFLPPPAVPSAPQGWQSFDPQGPLLPTAPPSDVGPREQQGQRSALPVPAEVGSESSSAAGSLPAYALEDLLSLAVQNNPTIQQARLQISAQTAKALQAGLYPNPMLRYVGEQIGVDVPGDTDSPGEFQGMTLSQRFVTAGKLRLSREKYMRRAHVSEHLAMAQQFRVCNDVRIHFYQTLAAQRIVALRQELLKTTEDRAVTARELYNVGQQTRAEVHQANIALQRARLNLLAAENHSREQFRRTLAIVGFPAGRGKLVGSLADAHPPIAYQEAVDALLIESPQLAAARAKLAADRVTLQRERVEWIPDITAEGGAGYNFEAKETTAAAGVSIKVPVFDRNQGTIRQAQLDYRRQQEEIRRLELQLQQQMATTYQQYLTALQFATEYERVIVPEAKLAYEELLESYQANRIDWPAVLAAQLDYLDARLTGVQQWEQVRTQAVLVRGYLLHGGLMAAAGPTPPGHIDAVAKPR